MTVGQSNFSSCPYVFLGSIPFFTFFFEVFEKMIQINDFISFFLFMAPLTFYPSGLAEVNGICTIPPLHEYS